MRVNLNGGLFVAGRRLRIYVESSVVSAYHFAPKPMMLATRRFFERAVEEGYELFTSDVAVAEFEKAREEVKGKSLKIVQRFKIRIVSKPGEADDLADKYIEGGVIPRRYRPDAEHIAVASVMGFDVLVSWNLAHIVRFKTKRMVRIINGEQGYPVPEILRPDEV